MFHKLNCWFGNLKLDAVYSPMILFSRFNCILWHRGYIKVPCPVVVPPLSFQLGWEPEDT